MLSVVNKLESKRTRCTAATPRSRKRRSLTRSKFPDHVDLLARFDVGGIEYQHGVKTLQGFVPAIEGGEQVRGLVQRMYILRLQGSGFLGGFEGGFKLSGGRIAVREGKQELGIVVLELDRGLILDDGLIECALRLQGVGEDG